MSLKLLGHILEMTIISLLTLDIDTAIQHTTSRRPIRIVKVLRTAHTPADRI